jgi:hypothetical protein
MTTHERELDPSAVATLGRDELLFASISVHSWFFRLLLLRTKPQELFAIWY